MFFKNLQIAAVILGGILCLAPVCPLGGGGTLPPGTPVAPDGPVLPEDPGEPPTPLDPESEIGEQPGFTGDLGCRPVGMQPKWLRADLPIPMAGCSRNYQIHLPYAVYNSRAAGDPAGHVGAFGKGWSLEVERTLEHNGNLVIVRDGALNESHFTLHESATIRTWVPEPYSTARLIEPAPGQDAWVLVDLTSNSRVVYRRFHSGPVYRVSEIIDWHGKVTYFVRDPDGRLEYISDSIVAGASDRTWWFYFEWQGSRISMIMDSEGRPWLFSYNGQNDLERIDLPNGRSQSISYQSGTSLISDLTMPGLVGHSMSFDFDSDGHLEEIRGLDGSVEYRIDWNEGPEQQMLDIYGPYGSLLQYSYLPLPWGWYLFSQFSEGRSMMYDRNFEGYLERMYDDQGRLTVYQPDDAPRPGTTTTVRRPENMLDQESYLVEITHGPFGRPAAMRQTPGLTVTAAYAGIDECGFEPPDWAFLKPCRLESTSDVITYTYRTENPGTPDERRITIFENSSQKLSGWKSVHNYQGQLLEQRNATGMAQKYTYNDRGQIERVEEIVRQSGSAPATYGVRVTRQYDRTGLPLLEASEPLSPVPDRVPVSFVKEYGYEADGSPAYVLASTSGRRVQKKSYQLRNAIGIPELETLEVFHPDSTPSGFIRHEFDEFGRVLQTTSYAPDPLSGEPTPYGKGQIMEGGRRTYHD